jgi:predicted PurR-regulated permease PerM
MPKFTKSKEPKSHEATPQPYERAYSVRRGTLMLNNFLGGISWAVGTVVGLAVFLFILGLLTQYIDFIPFIGEFIGNILDYLQQQGRVGR